MLNASSGAYINSMYAGDTNIVDLFTSAFNPNSQMFIVGGINKAYTPWRAYWAIMFINMTIFKT